MNNKAVKRTGFVEYCDRKAKIDMRYFEALAKIPSLEMISKMGMTELVTDLIYADDKDIPGYLKKDDKGMGLKRLTKPQMQSLINGGLSSFILCSVYAGFEKGRRSVVCRFPVACKRITFSACT